MKPLELVTGQMNTIIQGVRKAFEQKEQPMSNCCSARVYSPTGDWAICMDCKEHCEAVLSE